ETARHVCHPLIRAKNETLRAFAVDYAVPNKSGLQANRRLAEDDLRENDQSMMTYWVQFAASGEPKREGRPHWPAYDAETDAHLELGDSCHMRSTSTLFSRSIPRRVSLKAPSCHSSSPPLIGLSSFSPNASRILTPCMRVKSSFLTPRVMRRPSIMLSNRASSLDICSVFASSPAKYASSCDGFIVRHS